VKSILDGHILASLSRARCRCSPHVRRQVPIEYLAHFFRALKSGLGFGHSSCVWVILRHAANLFASCLPGNEVLIHDFLREIDNLVCGFGVLSLWCGALLFDQLGLWACCGFAVSFAFYVCACVCMCVCVCVYVSKCVVALVCVYVYTRIMYFMHYIELTS
jgi:hypothetical protein